MTKKGSRRKKRSVLGKVGSRCQIDAGERNASARKGQSRYRRWDASLSADCAGAWVHARGTHTTGDTRESIDYGGTLLVELGEQLERGEGKSERESVRLRAFARASIKASAAGRSVHFSRAFETGNPADSSPPNRCSFSRFRGSRVLSVARLIACIRKKRKRIEERIATIFFFLSLFETIRSWWTISFSVKETKVWDTKETKKVYINIHTFWWKLLFSVIRCFEVEVWKENREKKEGWKDESWRRSGDWVKLLDGKKSLTESSKWFDGSVDTVGDPEAGLSVLEIATMSGILYCWRGKRVVIGSRATRRFTTIWSKPAAR